MKIKRRECGSAELFLGDCLGVIDGLPQVDAVIMDPPYCSGGATESARSSATHQGLRSETMRDGKAVWFGGDNMTTAGICELLRQVCTRVNLNPKGSILSFCDWRMVTAMAPAMESAGYRLRNIVAWDKGGAGLGRGFRPRHEMILHLSGRSTRFYAKNVGNVIPASRVHHTKRQHPTEKPVDLLEKLISVVAPPGGVVLDPFMGSGSTGVACERTGRRFVGIEVDPDFFDAASARISAEAVAGVG